MRNKILTAIMLLAAVVGFSACNEKWEPDGPQSGDKGTLSTADLSVDLTNAENIITRSRASVDLSNFIVTVTDNNGLVVERWTYATMPGLPVFNVGTYTLKVESGRPAQAAWDAPYFVGEKQFTIVKDDITNAGTVVCSLQNLKVTVRFAEDLVAASAGDLQCEIRVNEEGVLKFSPAERRSGYFEIVPGNTTMVATFSGTVNNYKEEIIRLYKDLNPGQHRIITFALKGADINPPAETGFIDPTGGLNVDFSVIDEDLNVNVGADEGVIGGDRPGHEDWPDNPEKPGPDQPGPVDPAPGTEDAAEFTSPTLNLKGINPVDIESAVVNIACKEGANNLNVTIKSTNADFIASAGELMPMNFDLANPGDAGEGLASVGLPVGDQVIGKTEITFDITALVPLLGAFPGDHQFTLEVIDSKGNKSTLVLKFKA